VRHDLKPIIDDIVTDMRAVTERGTVASYIPGLACADPNRFGIAVVTAEGEVILGGDAEIGFSIQRPA
jgi:glutaminase